MNTRTVKITRTVTKSAFVVVEIPATATNEDLKNCLYDRCEVYESVLYETDDSDMSEMDERIDVEDSKVSPAKGMSMTDDDWLKAMKDDKFPESNS